MSDVTDTLVDPDWLAARLGDPKVKIVAINRTDAASFDSGHMPGAINWRKEDRLWLHGPPTSQWNARHDKAAVPG